MSSISSKSKARVAQESDAEAITELINSAFRPAEEFFVGGNRIETEEVKELLRKGAFLLLEEDGKPAGCVYVEPQGERAYLGLLSVNPANQKGGFGSELMSAGEDYCRERGCRVMDIKVVNLRQELFAFYEKRGYVETGTSSFPADVETKLPCHFVEMSRRLDSDS
jgi:N-acetylglutamate synthase-like GNAT family acetyltransferase